jgi:hypothetical protein
MQEHIGSMWRFAPCKADVNFCLSVNSKIKSVAPALSPRVKKHKNGPTRLGGVPHLWLDFLLVPSALPFSPRNPTPEYRGSSRACLQLMWEGGTCHYRSTRSIYSTYCNIGPRLVQKPGPPTRALGSRRVIRVATRLLSIDGCGG